MPFSFYPRHEHNCANVSDRHSRPLSKYARPGEIYGRWTKLLHLLGHLAIGS